MLILSVFIRVNDKSIQNCVGLHSKIAVFKRSENSIKSGCDGPQPEINIC